MATQTPAMNNITMKRLAGELKKLKKSNLGYAQACQDETNPFIFYFLLVGDKGSPYEGGYYIGKIILSPEHPNKPGSVMMLTPSGRFTAGTKICLTNTDYHMESFSPIWTVEQMIMGIYSIFIEDKEHGISHIKQSINDRKIMAANSVAYNLKHHSDIFKRFDQFVDEDGIPLCTLNKNQPAKTDIDDKKNNTNDKDNKDNKKDELKQENKLVDQPEEPQKDVQPEIVQKDNKVDQSVKIENFAPTKIPFFKKIGTTKKPEYLNLTDSELLNLVKKMSIRTFTPEPFELLHSKFVLSLSAI